MNIVSPRQCPADSDKCDSKSAHSRMSKNASRKYLGSSKSPSKFAPTPQDDLDMTICKRNNTQRIQNRNLGKGGVKTQGNNQGKVVINRVYMNSKIDQALTTQQRNTALTHASHHETKDNSIHSQEREARPQNAAEYRQGFSRLKQPMINQEVALSSSIQSSRANATLAQRKAQVYQQADVSQWSRAPSMLQPSHQNGVSKITSMFDQINEQIRYSSLVPRDVGAHKWKPGKTYNKPGTALGAYQNPYGNASKNTGLLPSFLNPNQQNQRRRKIQIASTLGRFPRQHNRRFKSLQFGNTENSVDLSNQMNSTYFEN